MYAIDYLKQQHREALSLFQKLDEEEDKKQRRELVAKLGQVLRGHMMIEEKLFYPMAERVLGQIDSSSTIIVESFEEHAIARTALETLESTRPDDKRFSARAKVLKDIFEHHLEEEEHEMMPQIEEHVDRTELESLGDKLESRFEALQRQGARAGARRGRAAAAGPAGRRRGRAAPARAAKTGARPEGRRRTGGPRRGAKRASAAKRSSARGGRRTASSRGGGG